MAEKQDKAGCGMQIFAFLLLAGLILLVGWFGSRQCDKWAAENEAEYLSKPIQQVHIRELLEAYDQNVANADAKYGNARLMVTGTVTQVYPDGTIRLDAGAHKYRYSTGVIMEKEHYDWLLELRKGQTIRVECAQVNLISATDLVAADCRRPEPTTGRSLTTATPQSTAEKHRATIDTRRSAPILPTPNTSMTELLQFTPAPPTYVPPVTTRPTMPMPTPLQASPPAFPYSDSEDADTMAALINALRAQTPYKTSTPSDRVAMTGRVRGIIGLIGHQILIIEVGVETDNVELSSDRLYHVACRMSPEIHKMYYKTHGDSEFVSPMRDGVPVSVSGIPTGEAISFTTPIFAACRPEP